MHKGKIPQHTENFKIYNPDWVARAAVIAIATLDMYSLKLY